VEVVFGNATSEVRVEVTGATEFVLQPTAGGWLNPDNSARLLPSRLRARPGRPSRVGRRSLAPVAAVGLEHQVSLRLAHA
jgi:hypothetical protein